MIMNKNKIVVIAVIVFILVLGVLIFQTTKNKPKEISSAILEIQNLVVNQNNYAAGLVKAEELVKKEPKNAEAWQWKGIAEFQLGKTNEAKLSFEKVLALDPENKSAKTYLEILNTPNTQLLTQDDFVQREAFEKFFDFPLPLQGLEFVSAQRRPFDESRYSAYIAAEYAITISPKTISAFFENELKKRKETYKYSKSETSDSLVFLVNGPESDFAISISEWDNPKTIISQKGYQKSFGRTIIDLSEKK